ncbi:pyrroline-5-carboxylate reductase [Stappia sp. GBMRC 2046]|uniref:Pyrroline-5-carboxylate reductase n=2 Tax=Stappia sediminis TaxID=2692190 RepID=A0A7X3S9A8_9HYPH|nr:pyrroline-5-carboxylate reductase [Stappia sediminis]
MAIHHSFGIIGGSGQLGGAIARQLLLTGTLAPDHLWISNTSGKLDGFRKWPFVRSTTDNQELAQACETILLSVPPHVAKGLELKAEGRLVVSVVAGLTVERIGEMTGTTRIVRAMSSPAAEYGLAYSPWVAAPGVTEKDRETVGFLFKACGLTDEVSNEDQIDRFTALTGPVPGFVALFADCMAQYALRHGVDPKIADRAVRQLFHASGVTLSETEPTPAERVAEMIAYAGTTAAGLEVMRNSALSQAISDGLDAAYDKAKSLG